MDRASIKMARAIFFKPLLGTRNRAEGKCVLDRFINSFLFFPTLQPSRRTTSKKWTIPSRTEPFSITKLCTKRKSWRRTRRTRRKWTKMATGRTGNRTRSTTIASFSAFTTPFSVVSALPSDELPTPQNEQSKVKRNHRKISVDLKEVLVNRRQLCRPTFLLLPIFVHFLSHLGRSDQAIGHIVCKWKKTAYLEAMQRPGSWSGACRKTNNPKRWVQFDISNFQGCQLNSHFFLFLLKIKRRFYWDSQWRNILSDYFFFVY